MSGLAVAGHPLRLDPRRRRTMLGVLPAIGAVMLHAAVLDLPRNDVVDALDTDRYRIYWVIGSYLLGGATGMAMAGFWRARWGLRRTLVAGLLLFSGAALLCSFATSVEGMAPWRLVAGYGMGLVLCAGMLVLWREFHADEELAMALYGMGVYLSALLGSVAGGLLLAATGWQTLFRIEVPLGLGAAALAAAFLPVDAPAALDEARTTPGVASPAARPEPERFDATGLVLLAAWVGTMVPVVVLGHYWGWLDSAAFVPWGLGFLAATILFVGWGTLAERPLVDLRPLARRNFGLGLAVKALFSVNLFALLSILSGYMIDLRGYQWWQGGLVFLPAALVMAGAMLASVRLGRDRNRKLRIFAGFALMTAVTWHLGRIDLYTSKLWLAAWLGVWGAGAGVAIGPTMLSVFAGLPQETLSHAAGVFNIFRSLPVFAIGSLLIVFGTAQQDEHFDRLRLRVTYDRPIVAATRVRLARHFETQGRNPAQGDLLARALLARWVGANAKAFALGDVLRVLALITACALPIVPLLRPPPGGRG